MRFIHLCSFAAATLCLSATTAFAQDAPAQDAPAQTAEMQTEVKTSVESPVSRMEVAPPELSILSVALPPQARLRLDVDARDEDILGVVKSLMRGFKGQKLKGLLSPPNSSSAPTSANNTSPSSASFDAAQAVAIQLLSDADLETVLRDVKHLRVVFFEVPYSRRSYAGAKPSTSALRPAPQSVVSFYEQAYLTREGGHRIARMDFDDVQMLTVGFPQRGFAMVFQAPGMGFVVRADGYPNLESVGPLAMGMMGFMGRSMR